MTREPVGREDASRGDLADDEIWGPAKRRHALFSCCPFLFAGGVGKRHNNDSAKRRNRESEIEKVPFDVAEQICTLCYPPTLPLLPSPPPPPNPNNRQTFDSKPDLDPDRPPS